MRKILVFAATLAFALGGFLSSCAAQASSSSRKAQAGPYTVALRVLPAESFAGSHSAMVWDGGAKPYLLGHSPRPNHHMVVFIKKQGKPVEKASVKIRYRLLGGSSGGWKTLPVVRMYVRGNGRSTMHYGNNVLLKPGNYAVRVQIAGTPPHLFHIHIGKS
ncbi:MAG TPA: hypothetical protein VFA48_00520 [Gammaproteobacteria bacterium]|nr:hypothetical protein [Gammaproteobacteria bacterium]